MKPEASIQITFWAALQRCTDPFEVVAWHIANEESKASQRIEKAKLGVVPGAPDFHIMWEGSELFIEFKSPRGKTTSAQDRIHARLGHVGRRVIVCRSVDEAFAALSRAGCPFTRNWMLIKGGTRLKLARAS